MQNRARPKTDPAFTLVEVIVVVVIVALLAAMVLPQFGNSSGLMAQSAARTVMADLEYAQNEAIVTQTPVMVTFSTTANSYTLTFPSQSQTLIHPITKKPYSMNLGTTGGMAGVSLYAADFNGNAHVTFGVLGAPDQGGTVTVVAGTNTYHVSVAPVTGRVTVTGP